MPGEAGTYELFVSCESAGLTTDRRRGLFTIHVVDAKGQSLSLVTALNGNFYTATPVTYPVQVKASLCPSTVSMVGPVQAPGSCNGCHSSGFRIHVP